jgi:hypothetical protein
MCGTRLLEHAGIGDYGGDFNFPAVKDGDNLTSLKTPEC